MTMPSREQLSDFWRGHDASVAVCNAALAYLRQVLPAGLYGPPLADAELERFREAVQKVHEAAFSPDNARPPRPALRLVEGD